uniref:Uncharacterized protein n=1 Tax=Arundo donax TaxID=35708 RepID=A0A0A8Z9W4_ARUDO
MKPSTRSGLTFCVFPCIYLRSPLLSWKSLLLPLHKR